MSSETSDDTLRNSEENISFLDKEYVRRPLESRRTKIFCVVPVILSVLVTSTLCLFVVNYYHLFTAGFFSTSGISKATGADSAITSSKAPSAPIYTNCGDSPAEARRRGCSFDLLSFVWQTKECYDDELMSAFLAYPEDGWKWFTHTNTSTMTEISREDEISQEVAALGEQDLYVTWDYHVVHCTFMWMQMHRAFAKRGYIDSHLDAFTHTKHCQEVALKHHYPKDLVNVRGEVRYPECRAVTSEAFW